MKVLSPVNGLSVSENWCRLLHQNLQRHQARVAWFAKHGTRFHANGKAPLLTPIPCPLALPLTDLQLATEIDRLYPGRNSQCATMLHFVRRYYQKPENCPPPYAPEHLATTAFDAAGRPVDAPRHTPKDAAPRKRVTPDPRGLRSQMGNPQHLHEPASPKWVEEEYVPRLDVEWYKAEAARRAQNPAPTPKK
jgi:hypothetical protein